MEPGIRRGHVSVRKTWPRRSRRTASLSRSSDRGRPGHHGLGEGRSPFRESGGHGRAGRAPARRPVAALAESRRRTCSMTRAFSTAGGRDGEGHHSLPRRCDRVDGDPRPSRPSATSPSRASMAACRTTSCARRRTKNRRPHVGSGFRRQPTHASHCRKRDLQARLQQDRAGLSVYLPEQLGARLQFHRREVRLVSRPRHTNARGVQEPAASAPGRRAAPPRARGPCLRWNCWMNGNNARVRIHSPPGLAVPVK